MKVILYLLTDSNAQPSQTVQQNTNVTTRLRYKYDSYGVFKMNENKILNYKISAWKESFKIQNIVFIIIYYRKTINGSIHKELFS